MVRLNDQDQFEEALPAEERQLVGNLHRLLDDEKYDEVVGIATERLEEGVSFSGAADSFLKTELANLLIDAGSEGLIPDAIRRGIGIYESNRDTIEQHVEQTSIEYNLGNAKSGLYGITADRSKPRLDLEEMELLTEAKNHYWRALKTSRSDMKRHKRMLRVNLGNALSQAGRTVEALQYYDEVLREDPEFSKANGNRARVLQILASISGPSTRLLLEVAEGYRKGAAGENVPSYVKQRWRQHARSIEGKLRVQAQRAPDLEKDRDRTEKEFEDHSSYRQFSLRNFLSLNEHALYCHCAVARRDTLTVETEALTTKGEFIPVMEHRLDRVKSEFSFARRSFYQALNQDSETLDAPNEDVDFTRPYEAESIGLRSELLRASFRTCFGILDKIAWGLCELYDLQVGKKESINFHQSLWNPNTPRWEALNSTERNSSHAALYSQATDLSNKTGGEWAVYRSWRNALEHGFLVLQEHPEAEDPGGVVKDSESVVVVPLGRFQKKALHLLQLTRSAIFNFAFCARVEAWKVGQGF